MGAAAVLGPVFDLRILASVLGAAEDDVVAVVEEAVASGLVHGDAEVVDHYGFVHALVHEVLLAELGTSRRARLEWRIGEVLAARRAGGTEVSAGVIARHFANGSGIGQPATAAGWSLEAGAEAMEQLAYEDAICHYESALRALDRSGRTVDVERADTLIALGRAANRAGDPRRWRSSCLEAASIARRVGDADRLGRATVSLLGTLAPGYADDEVVNLLDEADDALPGCCATAPRRALLAELLARHSGYLTNVQPGRSQALADEALRTARAGGDDRSSALALMATTQSQALQRSELHARLRQAEVLGQRCGDLDVILACHSNLMTAALLWAQRDDFDRHLAGYARLAEASRAPIPLLLSAIDHAGAAAMDGQYGPALAQFSALRRRSVALGDPNVVQSILAGMLPIKRELGWFERSGDPYRRNASANPAPANQALLVFVLSEAGQVEEATDRLDTVLSDPHTLLSGFLRRFSLAALAEAAAILGHTGAASQIRPWLQAELQNGDCVVLGPNTYHGAVRRYLGLLASTIGDSEQAVVDHATALEVHEGMRAWGWAARSRYDLALAVRARGHRGDGDAADRLLAEAAGTASRLGMSRLLEQAAEASA